MLGGQGLLIGTKADDILGEKYTEFIYKEDLKKVRNYFKRVFKGESLNVEYRVINNNGEVFHLDITLVPIEIENEVIGLYGLTHNISEKQELKHDIQKAKEILDSLIHYSHEIIGILDKDGTMIFESPSIEHILGYKVNEITGKNSFDLMHPDDLINMRRKFKEILNRPNTPITVELRLKHKNGEWRNFEII